MKRKIFWLIIFGASFAFVESAVVVYLRHIFRFDNLLNLNHSPVFLNLGFMVFLKPGTSIFFHSYLGQIERLRELATLIMLLAVAFLAGKNLKQKTGAFLLAFAFWDLFYYVFLRFLIGWPRSFLTMDVFFLWPVVWAGPVLTAVIASLLLAAVGIYLLWK